MNNRYIINNIYEILEDRIEFNEEKNRFNKKFLEIEKEDNSEINLSDEIYLYINEEYDRIKILIMIDDELNKLNIYYFDSENSNEEEEIYIDLYSIRLDYYYMNFKELIDLIKKMINDFLYINYKIKI